MDACFDRVDLLLSLSSIHVCLHTQCFCLSKPYLYLQTHTFLCRSYVHSLSLSNPYTHPCSLSQSHKHTHAVIHNSDVSFSLARTCPSSRCCMSRLDARVQSSSNSRKGLPRLKINSQRCEKSPGNDIVKLAMTTQES